jgi:hypothetical protein
VTDLPDHRWLPVWQVKSTAHPLRWLGGLVRHIRRPARSGPGAANPSLSTSIDRWLVLYLRAHL